MELDEWIWELFGERHVHGSSGFSTWFRYRSYILVDFHKKFGRLVFFLISSFCLVSIAWIGSKKGNLDERKCDNLVLYGKRVWQITVSKGIQSILGLELLERIFLPELGVFECSKLIYPSIEKMYFLRFILDLEARMHIL